MEEVEVDISIYTDREVFTGIKKATKNDRARLTRLVNNKVLLADRDGAVEGVEAYLVSVHFKRIKNIDYQLLVEATGGKIHPDEIDAELENRYGITPQTLLIVMSFAKTEHYSKEDLPEQETDNGNELVELP